MFWVVAPVFQVLPLAIEELRVTVSPAQSAVELPALITGLGFGFTVTVKGAEVLLQPKPPVTVTE